MLILNSQDIAQIYSMQAAIDADKRALHMDYEGQTDVPLRTHFTTQQGKNLIMPAYIKQTDVTGIKIVSVFPSNPQQGKPAVPAQIVLLDPQTGEVCALLDGTYVTQLRTGAVQGAATDLLARKDATRAVLIGTGGQAPAQLEAMLTVRPLTHVAIYGQNRERTATFVAAMRERFADVNVALYAGDDLDADIANADIITSVTTSKTATFNADYIKPGTHINAVGAYLPEMHEIPVKTLQQAAIRVLDTKAGVFAEAGDIIDPIQAGLVGEQDFIELGELVAKPELGRQNPQQITLFKSVGTAVLDVVVGYDIYCQAKAKKLGLEI